MQKSSRVVRGLGQAAEFRDCVLSRSPSQRQLLRGTVMGRWRAGRRTCSNSYVTSLNHHGTSRPGSLDLRGIDAHGLETQETPFS